MAITEAPSSSTVAPAAASDQALRRATPPAAPATAKDDAPRQAVPENAPKAEPPRAAPFAFTQHYDQDMHHLILEARDPVSGFVIYQMPPKYVVKQFSASVSTRIAPARGARVDSAV